MQRNRSTDQQQDFHNNKHFYQEKSLNAYYKDILPTLTSNNNLDKEEDSQERSRILRRAKHSVSQGRGSIKPTQGIQGSVQKRARNKQIDDSKLQQYQQQINQIKQEIRDKQEEVADEEPEARPWFYFCGMTFFKNDKEAIPNSCRLGNHTDFHEITSNLYEIQKEREERQEEARQAIIQRELEILHIQEENSRARNQLKQSTIQIMNKPSKQESLINHKRNVMSQDHLVTSLKTAKDIQILNENRQKPQFNWPPELELFSCSKSNLDSVDKRIKPDSSHTALESVDKFQVVSRQYQEQSQMKRVIYQQEQSMSMDKLNMSLQESLVNRSLFKKPRPKSKNLTYGKKFGHRHADHRHPYDSKPRSQSRHRIQNQRVSNIMPKVRTQNQLDSPLQIQIDDKSSADGTLLELKNQVDFQLNATGSKILKLSPVRHDDLVHDNSSRGQELLMFLSKRSNIPPVVDESVEYFSKHKKQRNINTARLSKLIEPPVFIPQNQSFAEEPEEDLPSPRNQQALPPLLSKDDIMKLPYTLESVTYTLNNLFKVIEAGVDKDLVVCIGNAGSGKSTLLTSMVEGTESLQIESLKYGNMNNKVISQTEGTKQKGLFEIGHSIKSQTFLPEFVQDPKSNLVYTDISGFNDTNGPFLDLIQSLLLQKLFLQARTVRFLVTFTHNNLITFRGEENWQLLNTMQAITQASNLNHSDILDSLVPLITQVQPNDNDVDIEMLRSTFGQQTTQQLKNIMKSRGLRFEKLLNNKSEPIEDEYVAWKNLKQYLDEFIERLEIYDPLDRNINGTDGQNQAIKRIALMFKIQVMNGIKGHLLNAPMNLEVSATLEKMFEQSELECAQVAKEYIQESIDKGQLFLKKFANHQKIVKLTQQFEFLQQYKLVYDIDRRVQSFKQLVEQFEELIQSSKVYKQKQKFSRDILDLISAMQIAASEKKYDWLIGLMGRACDFISENYVDRQAAECTNQQTKERDEYIQKAKAAIGGIISRIAINSKDLMRFVFKVRKLDKKDAYTTELLSSTELIPPILRDIIQQNRWNSGTNTMAPTPTRMYHLINGKHYLGCDLKTKEKKLKLTPDSKQAALIQFKLCEEGLKIMVNRFEITVTSDNQVQQGQLETLSLGSHTGQTDTKSLFLFVPGGSRVPAQREPGFTIEHTYGIKRPRMVSICQKNSTTPQSVQMTLDDKHGYEEMLNSHWQIIQAGKVYQKY